MIHILIQILDINNQSKDYQRKEKPTSAMYCLQNMVDSNEVDEDLEREVYEECSKFGIIQDIYVYQSSNKSNSKKEKKENIKIFILYQNLENADKAQFSLDNRYFGGNVITCEFYDETKFLNNIYSD
ncbi:splicing factor 45 spf45 [Anaeramoeba ignava]|uniref:Splicing factor 45 spf45 n=1 Tax=Anaeramoeba ignava TaxID=1746090 RepID=A0A9Q0RIA7_ANAIG|nr:splicing factor 45 spf45 [Anaeramoeba ignava]